MFFAAKLAVTGALLFAASAAVADVATVRFTASGVVTESYILTDACEPGTPCDGMTPAELGMPSVGTAWQMTADFTFAPPVPDSGFYYEFEDFTSHFTLTAAAGAEWIWPDPSYTEFMDPLELVAGRPVGFLSLAYVTDCLSQQISLAGRALHLSTFSCGGDPEGITGAFVEAAGQVDRLWVNGVAQPVPEPGSWVLLIAGFGLAGATLRARRPAYA